MKSLNELTQSEILALAISSEEEDGRIYGDFAEAFRQCDTAQIFSDMVGRKATNGKCSGAADVPVVCLSY